MKGKWKEQRKNHKITHWLQDVLSWHLEDPASSPSKKHFNILIKRKAENEELDQAEVIYFFSFLLIA